MQRYRDYRPTSYDPRGLNGDRYGIAEWFVVGVIQTRDSGPLERSNFRVALRELGGESDTVQVHRFGHWGPGWYEIIVIDPSRESEGQAIEDSLTDYPILSESDYSELEYETACETWTHMSIRDRVEVLQRYRGNIFAARRDEVPDTPTGELISYLAEP